MSAVLLGIDIGTSACKVALHTPSGEVLFAQSAAYPTLYPAPGWAEQSPDAWWAAASGAIRAAIEGSGVRPSDIAGIGIAGQSWSAIPLGADGAVLANTPIWTDTRAADICEKIAADIGDDTLFGASGNPFAPTYTLPKMLWFKAHRPDVYSRATQFLQSNSFIAFRLTGKRTQDRSQGYGLHCFDMRKGCWDEPLARALGIAAELLPEIVPCHAVIGGVTDAAARETGLLQGTPVVAGGLDAACGTLGAGVIDAGQAQEQGGQAGGMSICLDAYAADPRLILSEHVVPGRWLLQGGTTGGGGMLRWLRDELLQDISFERMSAEAETVPAGSDGLLCLPYMAGERSPLWDPRARGMLFGLSFAKTKGHVIRAAMEGVAYSLLHNLETAKEAGAAPETLRAMGGAANSLIWTQIKADVTGKRIEVPASDTATTLGVAILAGVGTGVYAGFGEAVRATVRLKREHLPNKSNQAVYQKGYGRYLALYEATKGIMWEG